MIIVLDDLNDYALTNFGGIATTDTKNRAWIHHYGHVYSTGFMSTHLALCYLY
jgi:hypothetical protein